MEFILAFVIVTFIVAITLAAGWVVAQSRASAALDETLARRP